MLRYSVRGSAVLIPSWLGWVLERIDAAHRGGGGSLNPFLVRVGVGTKLDQLTARLADVLIPSWLGWVLEPLSMVRK